MQNLMQLLKEGIVTVRFTKKDGSLRTMRCTLNDKKIPSSKQPKGTGKGPGPGILPVYDVEKNDWRSFRLDSVKSYQ